MLFYKGLYGKKTVQGVDLNNMLHGYGIPQVEEGDKEKLEWSITYGEVLFCPKKLANNTSHGFDGFTMNFSSPELCSGWAILITFCPSMRLWVNIFKRLLLCSQFCSKFIWSLLRLGERKIAKMVTVH